MIACTRVVIVVVDDVVVVVDDGDDDDDNLSEMKYSSMIARLCDVCHASCSSRVFRGVAGTY